MTLPSAQQGGKQNSRFFFLAGILLALSAGFFSLHFSHKITEGRKVPDFRLESFQNKGQFTSLSEINRDNPIMLAFWASWCPSCVEEIPEINAKKAEWAAKGLKVYGINVAESRNEVTVFIKKQAMDFPVLLDKDGKAAREFGLSGLPATVVLGRGGKVIYFGFSLPKNMDELLHQGDPR